MFYGIEKNSQYSPKQYNYVIFQSIINNYKVLFQINCIAHFCVVYKSLMNEVHFIKCVHTI